MPFGLFRLFAKKDAQKNTLRELICERIETMVRQIPGPGYDAETTDLIPALCKEMARKTDEELLDWYEGLIDQRRDLRYSEHTN